MQRFPLARFVSRTTLALVAMLALATGVVAGCGDSDDTATTGAATAPAATGPATAADTTPPTEPTGVDRAFASQMIPHHEGAIEMAVLARDRARTAFVRNLAGAVERAQEAEIAVLRKADRRLAAAGVRETTLGLSEAEMGMDHDMAMLRDADDFDRAFVEMMIPHHEGAIAMAQVQLAKGGDSELRALAQEIVTAQQGEIDAMRTQLGEQIPDGTTAPDSGTREDDSHSGH